ncbi:MAG TPA: hypothetical protein VH044_14710 [Polyangiaceae bacterium]|nr:hypothetical protein [Polyangiaceae bacterium]
MLAIPVSWAAFSCAPTLDDHTSIVTSPQVLAVQATPAEGSLGATFSMTALYVDANGPRDPSELGWAMCLKQKPLGEPGPLDPGCFVALAPELVQLGGGTSVQATIPADACQLFGPDSPPPQPGQPSARPTDPDTTGGYYLPVRLESAGGHWSAALERLACQPSGVTQAVFTAFTDGYHANTNPTVTALSRTDASGSAVPIAPDAPSGSPDGPSGPPTSVATVTRGQHVSLRVDWPACAATEACGGAEGYIAIDPTSKQITPRRESMVASWYATGGAFDEDRSGRSETDPSTSATNGWRAPTTAGIVHLWVVLRDARGGVGWTSYTLSVM